MKLTDRRFLTLWIIAELLIFSFCIYDVIVGSAWEVSLFVAILCQLLMVVLILFRKNHSFGVMVNLIIVLIYSFYSAYLRLGFGASDMYWVLLMMVLPNIQLALLLIYWGVEKIAQITESKK